MAEASVNVEKKDEFFVSSDEKSEKTIVDYEKDKIIGTGGFANVWVAKDKASNETVAIKECYKNHLIKKKQTHTVMRERKALMMCHNIFIIKLLEFFQDDLSLYMVMEFAENGTLADYMKKYKFFSQSSTKFYTAEIILGLEYLRTVRIVHRDLKQENILLDSHYHAKISDFGTCCFFKDAEDASQRPWVISQSQVNAGVGTDGYYSPEVLNQSWVTFGTDLWSLGCMIYEFHTGCMAFHQGRDNWDKIRTGKFIPFRNHKKFHPECADLIKKLLVVNPAYRLGINDMKDLKMHPFLQIKDMADWDKLHEFTPPPFGAELPSTGKQLFGASGGPSGAGGGEPGQPEILQWKEMVTPETVRRPRNVKEKDKYNKFDQATGEPRTPTSCGSKEKCAIM